MITIVIVSTLIGVTMPSPWINEMPPSVAALPEGKDPLPIGGSVVVRLVATLTAPPNAITVAFSLKLSEVFRVKPHGLGCGPLKP